MPTSNTPGESAANPKPKTISNPRRLLVVTPAPHSQATIPPFLQTLTGAPVNNVPGDHDDGSGPAAASSLAGYTTHPPLRIETKYYTAEVPIWVDEIPLLSSSPVQPDDGGDGGKKESQWSAEFLSDEARVVRDAIGAVVVCVQNPAPRSSTRGGALPETSVKDVETEEEVLQRPDVRAVKATLAMIGEVKSRIDEERGGLGEVPGLLVLMGSKTEKKTTKEEVSEVDEEAGGDARPLSAAWWEDRLYDEGILGFEVVEWDPRSREPEQEKRNKFGEFEGMRRIREVLETHDWSGEPEEDQDSDSGGFDLEVSELEREMMGLKFAVQNGEDDRQEDPEKMVEEMDALVERMRAIKDMSADMPESQRRAFASKAVRDLMKDL